MPHARIGRRGPTLPLRAYACITRDPAVMFVESPASGGNLGVNLFAFCVATNRADRLSLHVATLKVCFHAEPFLQSAGSAVLPLFEWASIALARSLRRRKGIYVLALPVAVSVVRVAPLRRVPAWREFCLSS